ncbi:MAG: aldehyde dehydrogenase family protein [Elusimicrobiota bacterium]|nr:aldehyde dehydrogenase family protein [Elusimicrobiota bacterium]
MKIEKTGRLFIDGKWISTDKTRDVINPADESVIGKIYEGTKEHVRLAAKAAKRAFPKWAKISAAERAVILNKVADIVDKNADNLVNIETANNGKPLRDSRYDIADTAGCFRYYAGLIDKPLGQVYAVPDANNFAMSIREPIGVCGEIVPWNYPLLMAAWKLAPSLAAGNTVVFKPASVTPLSVIHLFELIENLFPAGVINLVLGSGQEVGEEIAENPDIDKVSLTGGTDTGRRIMSLASQRIKNVSLELGGKSPCVIFDDVDLETGVDWALFAIFCNQGEVCSAGSRLILQDTVYDKFLTRLAKRANKIKVANGMVEGAEMGPLVSKAHMEKVLEYIEIGKKEARLLCGGKRLTDGDFAKGYFVAPTIFADCLPNMRIVKEEVFGPVLAVQKFSSEEEAIELANNTEYGLAAGVFTNDISRAMRVVKSFRAGITWINSYNPTFTQAPWGGYKQSGIGRELGTFGLEEYTEVKQININMAAGEIGWFEKR